ncbi:hypothetical protein S245_019774 [Arachis hypogaea]
MLIKEIGLVQKSGNKYEIVTTERNIDVIIRRRRQEIAMMRDEEAAVGYGNDFVRGDNNEDEDRLGGRRQ